jgi:hypothetical protein
VGAVRPRAGRVRRGGGRRGSRRGERLTEPVSR